MKIIIAGAGIGGLFVAGLLAKKGHTVTVYEKEKDVQSLSYDWHDDVNPGVIKSLSLPLPQGSFPKKNWTFLPPFSEKGMRLNQREDLIDFSVSRKGLAKTLFDLASPAKVMFGYTVCGVSVAENKVNGIYLRDGSGEERQEKADLVIDSCGVFSPLKKGVYALGIAETKAASVFFVERSFYKAKSGATLPYDTNKAYLKHIGEKGISWCIARDDETVDILIGRIGSLDKESIEKAKKDLFYNNPILSEEVVKSGRICTIPVRRPLSKFVCDGYAAIGDSACMTVPMIGSGIATSLIAARVLADVIEKKNSAKAADLWEYQTEVYRLFGAEHYAVETMKNWLLDLKDEDIRWFITSGILSNEDMQNASVGKMIRLRFPDVLHKGWIGIKKPRLLADTLKMLVRANKAKSLAKRIPKEYNEREIAAWQKKTDGLFQ